MFGVEMYYQVRRACLVEVMRIREASRVFSLHRKTVEKMLANATPKGYTRQRPPYRPKLEPHTGAIQTILQSDLQVPRKQRHTRPSGYLSACGMSMALTAATAR